MHGLRRRLSEPRMAGHRPADRSANQRVTSAGDSFLCIRMCGTNPTYIQSKKLGENRSCGKLEKCRIYWAILGFATETSLARWDALAQTRLPGGLLAVYLDLVRHNMDELVHSVLQMTAISLRAAEEGARKMGGSPQRSPSFHSHATSRLLSTTAVGLV